MRIGIVAVALGVLAACTDIASEDLLTSGMYADIAVTATGTGTSEVGAILRAGGPLSTTFVELTGDDELTATLGEETKALTPVSLGTIHSFVATFDADDPDAEYTIALVRTIDDGAPDTSITLPDPFELGELGVTEFSRADDALTVTWEPSGEADRMEATVDGDCFLIHSAEISGDPGTWTLEAGTLQDVGEESVNCEATVSLRRIRAGEVDAGYGEGGSARGVQVRAVTIQSTP